MEVNIIIIHKFSVIYTVLLCGILCISGIWKTCKGIKWVTQKCAKYKLNDDSLKKMKITTALCSVVRNFA